jgi:hypothetical protein
MKFAKRVYLAAGIYGLIVLLPMYFSEERTGRDFPPAITHPVFYYGFIGVASAWQVAFLIISRDPARFRPLMVASIVEKVGFGIPAVALFLDGRAHWPMFGAALIDLLLGVLFTIAYLKVRETPYRS